MPAPAPYPVQPGLTTAMRFDAQKSGDVQRMQAWAGQSAALVKNMERIVICRVINLMLMLMLMILPGFVLLDHFLRVHKLRGNSESKFEHGFVSGGSGFLRKKSDRCILLDRDRSLIGRSLTEEERKQG